MEIVSSKHYHQYYYYSYINYLKQKHLLVDFQKTASLSENTF
jgi:hypothetical protein